MQPRQANSSYGTEGAEQSGRRVSAAVEGLTGGRERRPGRRSHSLTHSFHLIPHLSPFPEEEGEPHRGPGAEAGQKKPTGQGSGSSESTGQ